MECKEMYVSKRHVKEYAEYLEELEKGYRLIEPGDQGAIMAPALLIKTTGKPPRQSFIGYEIVNVDVGRVSNKMCDVYVRGLKSYPLRFKIETGKLLIK